MFEHLKKGDIVTLATKDDTMEGIVTDARKVAFDVEANEETFCFYVADGTRLNGCEWPKAVVQEPKNYNLWYLGMADSRKLSRPHWCFRVDELETKTQMETRRVKTLTPSDYEVRADHRTESTETNMYEERPGVNWLEMEWPPVAEGPDPVTIAEVINPPGPDDYLAIIYDARDALNQVLPSHCGTLKEAVALAINELACGDALIGNFERTEKALETEIANLKQSCDTWKETAEIQNAQIAELDAKYNQAIEDAAAWKTNAQMLDEWWKQAQEANRQHSDTMGGLRTILRDFLPDGRTGPRAIIEAAFAAVRVRNV